VKRTNVLLAGKRVEGEASGGAVSSIQIVVCLEIMPGLTRPTSLLSRWTIVQRTLQALFIYPFHRKQTTPNTDPNWRMAFSEDGFNFVSDTTVRHI
jgi:hypothetical protein